MGTVSSNISGPLPQGPLVFPKPDEVFKLHFSTYTIQCLMGRLRLIVLGTSAHVSEVIEKLFVLQSMVYTGYTVSSSYPGGTDSHMKMDVSVRHRL